MAGSITVPFTPAVAPVPGVVKVADGPYSTKKVPEPPPVVQLASALEVVMLVAAAETGAGQAGGGAMSMLKAEQAGLGQVSMIR